MVELSNEVDENLAIMLHNLETCEADERGKLVDDISKLYRLRLEEKKLDNENDDAAWEELMRPVKERAELRNKIIDRGVDVGIAVMKGVATIVGYCLIARMHANSIVADSYGVLQRSASFRIIPNINPEKNL